MKARLLSLAFAVLLLPAPSWAQAARGGITGTVTDASGAVVPGASVIITNENTGVKTTVETSATGVYLAPALLPGNYEVAVQAQGFKRAVTGGLKVDVGTVLTRDVKLEIGAVSETVAVSAQTSQVETTSGNVGATIQVNQVLELPLADRNVYSLSNLVPGAFFVAYGEQPSNAFFANVSLGGSRTLQTVPTIDGVIGTQGGVGFNNVDVVPPVDSMQEFKVEMNAMSAEYGRSAGGYINAVTKSGTNQFHGSVYHFIRNDAFDALGWGNDTKPPLRRNVFGGTIGGPIIKNKTFFFYNYDGLRNRQAGTVTRDAGLPEWRKGDFSTAMRQAGAQAALVPIYDPDTGTGTFANPRGTLQFPGNVIPASRLDPIAVKVLAYYPNANRVANNSFTQQGNWQLNRTPIFARDYHTTRVDHELTSNTKVFFRFLFTIPERDETPGFAEWGPTDPNQAVQSSRHKNAALNLTHLFSPSFFLNFTAGVNRLTTNNRNAFCCDTNWAQQLGLPNVPGLMFPQFAFGGGLVPVQAAGGGQTNRQLAQTTFNYNAAFTKMRNSHTFKFGVAIDTYNGNLSAGVGASGQYTFDGRFTRGVNDAGVAIANTGINMADFLLGRLSAVSVTFQPTVGKRLQSYSGYFQDDIRVTNNLTLNLGMRYDTVTPTYGVSDRFNNFDPYQPNPLAGTGDIPAGALGVVTFQNRFGSGKYLYRWDKNNFAPRFGFAYRVFGSNNTVVRGGYGIFYGNSTPGGMINQVPIGVNQSYTASHPIPYRLRDGIPAGALVTVPESALGPTFGNRGTQFAQARVEYIDPNKPVPYTQNLNFGIQHQFKDLFVEAGYIGNLGRHLPAPGQNMNLIRPEMLSRTDIPERLRRPYTIFAGDQSAVVYLYTDWGISNYHAFTLKAERRLKQGLSWTIAYTLSKWTDNVAFTSTTGSTWGGDNNPPQNIYNRRNEKTLATNHIPHRLVISPIYELPFGKGKPFLNHGGVANALLGGWQVSVMGIMQKGSPFGASVLNGGRDILGDALQTLRPNIQGDGNAPNQGEPAAGVRGMQWLNPAAFTAPARFTYGNMSRTIPGVLGPGFINFDSMVAKNFRIQERLRAQFRWEMFNMTNTPSWGRPAEVVQGPNFGISTAGGRRIMQLSLKLYW